MSTKRQATVDDLYRVPGNGKAEFVDGEIVLMSPTGDLPGYAAFKITARLMEHGQRPGVPGCTFAVDELFLPEEPDESSSA